MIDTLNPLVLPIGRMARRLKVPAKWLREQADAGRVPCVRIDARHYLFAPSAVEAAVAKLASESRSVDSAEANNASR